MSTISASNANNNNNVARKQTQSVPRVSSATLKYYDIATQLLGKAGSDLEELFIAAARVSSQILVIIYSAVTFITGYITTTDWQWSETDAFRTKFSGYCFIWTHNMTGSLLAQW